jgi:hypothetical protein
MRMRTFNNPEGSLRSPRVPREFLAFVRGSRLASGWVKASQPNRWLSVGSLRSQVGTRGRKKTQGCFPRCNDAGPFCLSHAGLDHDNSRGPWWPRDTFDAAESVDVFGAREPPVHFQLHPNAAYGPYHLGVVEPVGTVSPEHDVEIHNDEFWIRTFSSHEFVLGEKSSPSGFGGWPNKKIRSAFHSQMLSSFHSTCSSWMKVVVNPADTTKPAYAHLFSRTQGARRSATGCSSGTFPVCAK